jgi:CRISPR system Cascade subunit CasE
MFLSRIELCEELSRTPEFWKQLASLDEIHKIAWSWFDSDSDQRRDFLYRYEGQGLTTRFYTLSVREPGDRSGLWHISSKRFAPKLAAGDRLEFSLRANPTRRKSSGPGKGKRADVVMDAKFAARSAEEVSRTRVELVDETCFEWLAARAEPAGFEIDRRDVRVDGYRPVRFSRARSRADATITVVDFKGRLTVRDPKKFVESITRGIGPAKVFGCGLMLIRRA